MADDKYQYADALAVIANNNTDNMRVLEQLPLTKEQAIAKDLHPIAEKFVATLQEAYFKAMDIEYNLRWAAKAPKPLTEVRTIQDKTLSVVDRWMATLSPEQKEALKHLDKT